ncbi:hypothetical protein B7494_g6702 [Chlorociboria aeruginascens]|nr:hypothetical protein B7494_g6702 [Chlorociboria aeruginascens]
MVSLWPWKGEDNSPASFEKALSALTTKISKSQSQLDTLRQRGRRIKALWTLYTSFAYLLCFIILFLVVGWKNLSALEYTGIAGSPVVIFLVRTGITAYYEFRVDNVTHRLEEQQAERTKTIDKLKAATKYNSTQELLEKYGETPLQPSPKAKKQLSPSKTPQKQPRRTSMGPPPTANIPRLSQIPSQPSTPQPILRETQPHILPSPVTPQFQQETADFAPNAFSVPPQYAQIDDLGANRKWSDRVLDLLLGEDETLPKNRMVLICQKCRLVNGQAPPGTKTLADVGKWRCFGCGELNGDEDEAVKVVKEMEKQINSQAADESVDEESSEAENDENDDVGEGIEDNSTEDMIEVKPKRGRPKGSKKS